MDRLTKSWETMPKVSSLGIKWKGGFKGSYIPVSELIDRKIVVNITNFDVHDADRNLRKTDGNLARKPKPN